MKIPSWTVLYNIVSKNSKWIGRGWEFFDEEADAERCYNEQNDSGNCATKRPFHKKTDVPHMGVCHRHLLNNDNIAHAPTFNNNE